MASRKADYDTLMVQEFLSKEQAMAYTNYRNEAAFDRDIRPYCHIYCNSNSHSQGDYYLPELRKRKLQLVAMYPQE